MEVEGLLPLGRLTAEIFLSKVLLDMRNFMINIVVLLTTLKITKDYIHKCVLKTFVAYRDILCCAIMFKNQ